MFYLSLQDTLVEKLRLKNSQLKVQKMKLDLQFKQVQYMFFFLWQQSIHFSVMFIFITVVNQVIIVSNKSFKDFYLKMLM